MSWSYNPKIAETILVWAVPRSLATTSGITFVFFSSRYLDVSVPWVCLLNGYYIFNIVGFPIRKSTDQIVCANPRSLSQLITSFIASESQGIPPALLHTSFMIYNKINRKRMSTIKNSARCFNINKIYIITICQRTFNCLIAKD